MFAGSGRGGGGGGVGWRVFGRDGLMGKVKSCWMEYLFFFESLQPLGLALKSIRVFGNHKGENSLSPFALTRKFFFLG